jgi:two-component system KDP operon response regulator KdpE
VVVGDDAKTILVVDDDPIIRKTTSMKLQAAGFRVLTAVDGSEAISIVGSQKPDIVLLDVDFPPDIANGGLPDWDGFKLMNWLLGVSNINGSRFIIATGVDSDQFESRALAGGAAAFFRKPIDYDKLVEIIQNQLNGATANPPKRKPNFEI